MPGRSDNQCSRYSFLSTIYKIIKKPMDFTSTQGGEVRATVLERKGEGGCIVVESI